MYCIPTLVGLSGSVLTCEALLPSGNIIEHNCTIYDLTENVLTFKKLAVALKWQIKFTILWNCRIKSDCLFKKTPNDALIWKKGILFFEKLSFQASRNTWFKRQQHQIFTNSNHLILVLRRKLVHFCMLFCMFWLTFNALSPQACS